MKSFHEKSSYEVQISFNLFRRFLTVLLREKNQRVVIMDVKVKMFSINL